MGTRGPLPKGSEALTAADQTVDADGHAATEFRGSPWFWGALGPSKEVGILWTTTLPWQPFPPAATQDPRVITGYPDRYGDSMWAQQKGTVPLSSLPAHCGVASCNQCTGKWGRDPSSDSSSDTYPSLVKSNYLMGLLIFHL